MVGNVTRLISYVLPTDEISYSSTSSQFELIYAGVKRERALVIELQNEERAERSDQELLEICRRP